MLYRFVSMVEIKNPVEEFVDTTKVNIYQHFEKTGYHFDWILLKLVENNLAVGEKVKQHKVVGFDFKDVSDGKGYRSQVFQVTLKFDNDSTYSFVVKIPAKDTVR